MEPDTRNRMREVPEDSLWQERSFSSANRRQRGRLLLYGLVTAVVVAVMIHGICTIARSEYDLSSAYSGTVLRCGTTYSFSRHPLRYYVLLRRSDGSTERRYVRREDFLQISVGDSVVKPPGLFEHPRVVRPD